MLPSQLSKLKVRENTFGHAHTVSSLDVPPAVQQSVYLPEGKRHCPNFLWGFPASAASCRLPPLSDSVGLRSCCWLLVCERQMASGQGSFFTLFPPLHWSGSSHNQEGSGQPTGGAAWMLSVHSREKGQENRSKESRGPNTQRGTWHQEDTASKWHLSLSTLGIPHPSFPPCPRTSCCPLLSGLVQWGRDAGTAGRDSGGDWLVWTP